MRDIQSHRLLWLKGALFLALGVASGGLLLAETMSFKAVWLLLLTVWAFCRAYYFAFYVIEHYVDPGFRFAGLFSFAAYWLRTKGGKRKH